MKKQELWKRYYAYLKAVNKKNPEEWVYRSILIDLARNKGYRLKTIWNAFEILDKCVQIGSVYKYHTTLYRYLNLSKEDEKLIRAQLKWFDSL